MPKRRAHIALAAGLTALFCGAGASMSHAQTMQGYTALREQVADIYADLKEQVPHIRQPSELSDATHALNTAQTAPGSQVAQELPPMPDGEFELMDLRLALVQLSFAVGSNDQITVVRAQPAEQPRVIGVQNGTVDFAQLREWVATQSSPETLMTGDTLRVPIVVLQNARLRIQPDDILHLSRADGAFIANLGSMIIDGAEISATAAPNTGASDFVPFVTTAGTGMVQISNSLFEGLGFGDTAAFSGVSVINRGLYAPIGDSFMAQNVLRDIGKVTFDGTDAAIIKGNIFAGEDAGTVELRHTKNARVIANIFADSANGSALRITDGSTGTTLTRNVVLSSASNGITVNHGSSNTIISDNIVWKSTGGGISITGSDCVYLANNIAIDNRRKGIELRTSQSSAVVANHLLGNQSSGLFVGDQPIGSHTTISDNIFVGNRIGLSSASAHRLTLQGNNFLNQFPRFLDGDLASQSHKIVADLRGEQDIDLTAGGIRSFATAPVTCTYKLDS
ncbi:right-handed parallel beta-helix repeat-containing protein [Yoonia maritima]|uniref:right-handed parallel beta-helix repeat-containing protein n=1 Tax=Yoonia maritima TaxID=1435347 RepID=UPI003735DB8D